MLDLKIPKCPHKIFIHFVSEIDASAMTLKFEYIDAVTSFSLLLFVQILRTFVMNDSQKTKKEKQLQNILMNDD